jgi:hypothetical protein
VRSSRLINGYLLVLFWLIWLPSDDRRVTDYDHTFYRSDGLVDNTLALFWVVPGSNPSPETGYSSFRRFSVLRARAFVCVYIYILGQ